MNKVKLWVVNLIWLFAFFFLSIFKSSLSEVLSSNPLAKRAPDQLTSLVPTKSRHDTALVATLDGTLSLVEVDTLKILWSIKTGLPIYSSYQSSRILDANLENSSGLGDDTFIDIGDDWNLYKHDKGKGILERLKSAKDLVRETKGLSKNGTTVIAHMATSVFIVDAKTGNVIRTVRFSDSSGLGSDDGEYPIILRDESEEQISITRTDYSFLAYSKSSGKVIWNVSLAEFEAESFCSDLGSSGVDNLQDRLGYLDKEKSEKCGSCLRQTFVYRIRDRGYLELLSGTGLIGEVSRTLPGDRVLPLPAPDLYFPVPVGELFGADHDSHHVLALPSSESIDPVQHPEVLALPSGAHSSSTMSPESSGIPFFLSAVMSGLLFIPVVYLLFRNVFVRRNKQTEDLKSKTITPKKKKSRKSGTTKNITVDDTKRGILAIDNGGVSENPQMELFDKKLESSFSSLVNIQVDGRKIGKLYVSSQEIGKGSNGTVVLEGIYDGRPVAVKRLVRTHHDVALKEIQNLMASDQHSNIVRFYGVELDSDFVYMSLERCLCSLSDLICYSESSESAQTTKIVDSVSLSGYSAEVLGALGKNEDFKMWKSNGYPSPQLLKLMRDVVSGIAHLHELGFIHRDLKPQNVLIVKEKVFCAKVSDMGVSKRLVGDMSSLTQHVTGVGSSGWRAPEQIVHGRQTRAVDLFSLGCVLFFCMTGGRHPYGDNFERDVNIVKDQKDLFLVEHVPEAVHLIIHLLNPNPDLRPKAVEVLHHPLFWNSEKRLSFLRDASDRVELEDREIDSDLLKAIEATAPVALGGKWDDKLEPSFLTNITRYRRYKYDSVRDILRVIRNKLNHYRELPSEIQEVLGSVPDGFDNYFTVRFPKLLIEVYSVICDYCWDEELLGKYFKSSLL